MAKYGVFMTYLKFWVVSVLKVNNQKVILISILTKSILIIHRKMTCCQSSAKQAQMKMKIGILININMTKSNMTFVFNIINVFINYSLKSDMSN